MELKIPVPKDATHIDIGPMLEPILDRLISLERRVGSFDSQDSLAYARWVDEKGVGDAKSLDRPVSKADISHYYDWATKWRQTDQRILDLTTKDLEHYLTLNGWGKYEGYSGSERNYNHTNHTPRLQVWKKSFLKRSP